MVKIDNVLEGVGLLDEALRGYLIIIGGAEDKNGSREILKEVCSKLSKDKDKLVVATVATELPEEVGNQYADIFRELGIKDVNILNVISREDAFSENNSNLLEKADMVFFTGGDQLRITSLLGGTPLFQKINEIYKKGCIFVGTSAGASVMSNVMVVSGPEEEAPRKCTLKMAPGLGLINGVIIDQHFAQRGRIGRLLTGIAENPESLGIGIDEDTAIKVNSEGTFEVIGSGAVFVIDGSSITYSNVSEQNQQELLSIFDVKIHILKKGNKFNLKEKRPRI